MKTINFSRIKINDGNWNIRVTFSFINVISVDMNNAYNEYVSCIYDIKNKELKRMQNLQYHNYIKKQMSNFIKKSKNTYLKENGL